MVTSRGSYFYVWFPCRFYYLLMLISNLFSIFSGFSLYPIICVIIDDDKIILFVEIYNKRLNITIRLKPTFDLHLYYLISLVLFGIQKSVTVFLSNFFSSLVIQPCPFCGHVEHGFLLLLRLTLTRLERCIV